MSVKTLINTEDILFLKYEMRSASFNTPEVFNLDTIQGHLVNYKPNLSIIIEGELVRVDLHIDIETQNQDQKTGAKGSFNFSFIYQVKNLKSYLVILKDEELEVNDQLISVLLSISFSTCRGILLTRLQGTPLQKFILPIVNPAVLLNKAIAVH